MKIAAELESEIRWHATRARPLEACGLVVWATDRDEIVSVRPTLNASRRPRHRFEIDRDTLLAAAFEPRPAGHRLGLYHSHVVDPAVPSLNDREHIGAWAFRPYLVFSCRSFELTAWQISPAGELESVPLDLV